MDEFDDDSGTIFRDVTLLALSAFVAMVLMLLPFINPGAEADTEARAQTDPGNVIIELMWAPELDADIDLWVMAPDSVPVGFPNKGNRVLNLLRDDLGRFNDLTDINYEVIYSRGIVPGEWIINVQAYRLDPDRRPPIKTKVVVSVSREGDTRPTQILEKEVELLFIWHEMTALRFELTEEGKLVAGSVNDLKISLIAEHAKTMRIDVQRPVLGLEVPPDLDPERGMDPSLGLEQ